MQQGRVFAAQAASGTLLGLVGVAAFCLAYGHGSTRLRWFACLLIGWVSFGVVTMLFRGIAIHPIAGLAIAVSALMLVRQLLPPPGPVQASRPPNHWDLPMRMVSAAALVFIGIFTILAALEGTNALLNAAASAIYTSLLVAALLRWGLTVLFVGLFVANLLLNYPATTNLSAWYIGATVFLFAVPLAMAVWAFYTAIGPRAAAAR